MKLYEEYKYKFVRQMYEEKWLNKNWRLEKFLSIPLRGQAL
jgi:hypothetical protein